MKVVFLGHAAFQVIAPGLNGLIDPFLDGNSHTPHRAEDFTDINYIFVTHGHADHLGDTIEIARANKATVISNAEICDFLSGLGLTCHAMHIGGRYRFPFGSVKLTPALHGSAIETRDGQVRYGGNPCGFLIEAGERRLYHAGDTGLTKDMELLSEEQIDLALVPIGGNYTMDLYDAARAVRMIEPVRVVPMHYDTFPVIQADPLEFISQVNDAAQVLVLKPGEIVVI